MNKEAIGTLTGKFFYSDSHKTSDRVVGKPNPQTIGWSGQFLGLASPGLYRVQVFDRETQQPLEQRLVPAVDMRYWLIFETLEGLNRHIQNVKREIEAAIAAATFRPGVRS